MIPNWKRSLIALWIANFVTAIGMLAMVPFLTYFVEELGINDPGDRNLWAGILVGAAPISAAVMGPIWGGIGDRFGRKSMVLRAIFAIVIFVGLMAFARNVYELLLLRILQGLFSGYVPPSMTLVSVQAPPHRGAFVIGIMQSSMPAGAVFGYAMGGQFAERGLMREVFPICAILAFASTLLVLFAVRETEPPKGGSKSLRAIGDGIVQDFRYLLSLPALVRFLGLVVVVRFLTSTFEPSYARYVEEVGGSPLIAGKMLSLDALMLLIFMPVWSRFMESKSGPRRVFALCAVGLAASLAVQSLAPNWPLLLAARLIQGVFLAGVMPAGYGMAAKTSSLDHRGSAIGMVFLALALSHALGTSVGGPFLNAFGFRTLLAATAIVCLATALIAYASSRKDQRLRMR